jgi:predicted RNase H-like nuclease
MKVIGLDGCSRGWIGVVLDGDEVSAHYFANVRQVVEDFPDVQVIAIDIPMGLLDSGPRRADILARGKLPGRASTIFNAPARACLVDVQYLTANEISQRVLGKGLSQQSYALLPKIREVDDFWLSAPCPVWEVHPELSFAKINDWKMLPSKKSWAGMLQRRDALSRVGIVLDDVVGDAARRASTDDMLDAGACAWSAREIFDGRAIFLPDPPEVDVTGREATIRV